MRTKAEILNRIKELEAQIDHADILGVSYESLLGRIKALYWVLNKD